MASVFNQSYPNIEWIVQDGGSTDGTMDKLRPHADRIKLVSERDSGVYDAWNRALDLATGDWAIFLGADDFFVSPHSIAQCHHHLRGMPPHIDMAYGALLMGCNGKAEHLLNRTMHRTYNTFLSDMGVPFPATFIRVPVLQRERFDDSYKIAGDFEFAARIPLGNQLDSVCMRTQLVQCAIFGAAVLHNPFYIGIGLAEDRGHQAGNVFFAVIHGSDN